MAQPSLPPASTLDPDACPSCGASVKAFAQDADTHRLCENDHVWYWNGDTKTLDPGWPS